MTNNSTKKGFIQIKKCITDFEKAICQNFELK